MSLSTTLRPVLFALRVSQLFDTLFCSPSRNEDRQLLLSCHSLLGCRRTGGIIVWTPHSTH